MTRQNLEQLRLYGVTSFPFFKPQECLKMLNEASSYTLTLAQKEVGNRRVKQRFFETTVNEKSPFILSSVSNIKEYVYNTVVAYEGTGAFVAPLNFEEIRLHKYPIGGILDFHRDDKVFKNLIVNVLLKGESSFYTADDVEGTNKRLVPASVGWCIVLSGTGLFGQSLRSPHCVAGVTKERWTLGMRDGFLE